MILRRAQRELQHLPYKDYDRVCEAIRALAQNPIPPECFALKGYIGWRIHIRDYRVIYEIDEAHHLVTILHVGHRRDVYG